MLCSVRGNMGLLSELARRGSIFLLVLEPTLLISFLDLPCLATPPFASLSAFPSPPTQASRPGTFNGMRQEPARTSSSSSISSRTLRAQGQRRVAAAPLRRDSDSLLEPKALTPCYPRSTHRHRQWRWQGLRTTGRRPRTKRSSKKWRNRSSRYEEAPPPLALPRLVLVLTPFPPSLNNSATTASTSQEEEFATLGERPVCVH